MTIEHAMLKWLHDSGNREAVKLLRYEEVEQFRVCGEGTCGWDEIVVRMYYVDAHGNEDYDYYEGELGQFIRELTKE